MSETKNKNKRRLSITLSLFTHHSSDQNFSKRKTPKIFEEPNGVVGLGILAAMHDGGPRDLVFAKTRAAILAIAPKSLNRVPILTHRNSTKDRVRKRPSFEEMEMSEEYTCVISHVGKNLVKKREYFDGDFLGVTEGFSEKFVFGTSVVGDADASGDWTVDFLNSCFLCKKQLHGLDIFMYRGEAAFCSAECRYKQISVDEHEKCRSGVMKPTDSFQCFSGVATT